MRDINTMSMGQLKTKLWEIQTKLDKRAKKILDLKHERKFLRQKLEEERAKHGWIGEADRVPEDDRKVLVVKRLKSGKFEIGIGHYAADFYAYNPATGRNEPAPSWVCQGNNNVIAWMELPNIPVEKEEGDAGEDRAEGRVP